MKQKLTLLLIALFTTVGAWATSPAEGAYPVEGKQYYIFAIHTDNSRTYLYNSSNSLALNQGSKENTDAYKWTVTISGGKYIVKNVANTDYYLGVNSVLALTTSSKEWSLGKTVSDPACVSLYDDKNESSEFTGGVYYVTNKSGNAVSSGMFLTSKNGVDSYATNGNWTASYVFEEVLSTHSLTDGKYYTIYCDNDNKQYLYDNAGTLAQTSSVPDSDLKYVWQCIVNGDYYNFRNLQTGKYLGWRAISASAYNYTITTTQAIHDGCATMWGVVAEKNWSIKNDGTLTTGQTTTKDDKVTSVWCTDFRFDEIDLSDWCIGDLLGGSVSGSNNWTNSWTSGTTLQFTLTATANDINHKNDRKTGGLDIRSGSSSAGYDTYTINAPTGYLVTGYKIAGYALKGDQTVTPSTGGDATVFTTAGNSITVSGLRQVKASFKLSGDNDGLFIRALQVSLEPIAGSITSLPTANNKAYVIYNARAAWNFADNATSMNALALDLNNAGQQIALIYHNDNYYLYSINAKKYLTASNTLTSVITDDEQISITATGNATYPWFFKFKNVADKNINIDGNPSVQINYYNTSDEGNRNAIVEVDDFDATEALAMFNNHYATYNLSYGGNNTFRTSNVAVAPGGNPADYVPESWKAAYCTLTYDVETIEESTTTVNVTMTWNGPFDISANYESAVWYYMKSNNMWAYYDSSDDTKIPVVSSIEDAYDKGDAALWAFVGNPCDGVQVINKAKGRDYFIDFNDVVKMVSSGYTVTQIEDGGDNGFALNNTGYSIKSTSEKLVLARDTDSNRFLKVRSYYCQKFIEDIYDWADANHRDELFGPSETSLTDLQNIIISMYPNMTSSQYSGFTIPDDILPNIVVKYPSTGYYRIKNNGTGNYIAYGQPSAPYVEKNPGLIAISSDKVATDFSSIIKLTGSSGTYKISSEGLNVQSQTTGNQAFPATSAEGVNFVFTSANKDGIVSITNVDSRVDDNNDGSLHQATGWTVNGIVNWSASADNSKWIVEDVTEVTIPFSGAIGGKSYATFSAPFDVTIGDGAKVYTVKLNGDRAVYTEIEDKKVPAGAGVLLISETAASSVTATINTGEAFASLSDNDLIGGIYSGTNFYIPQTLTYNTGADGTWYLGLGNHSTSGIGFYQISGTTGANKAYLPYAYTASSTVKGFILVPDEDDATGIETIDNEQLTIGNEIYNLAGQRLGKTQKGINIVNGKKVLK